MRLGCPDLTSEISLDRLKVLISTVWNKDLYPDNVDDLLKLVADLRKSKDYIAFLEAEVQVRANPKIDPLIPKSYCYQGAASAYLTGFDEGWKRQEFHPTLYKRRDRLRAYTSGYCDGAQQATEKILALKAKVI